MENLSFTIRIKPFDGESLSSFLLRLADANGIELLVLLNHIRKTKKHYIQTNEICTLNFYPINSINFDALAAMTGVEKSDLLNTTFSNVLDKFCYRGDKAGSRFLSGMLRDDYYYCPECLTEKLFNRLIWNISNINSCIKHGQALRNYCPHCYKALKHKDIRKIGECPSCGANLYETTDNCLKSIALEKQKWLYSFWNILMSAYPARVKPDELAHRILYVLSNYQQTLARDDVKAELSNDLLFSTLMQHARGTLSQQRTLHLTFLINVLLRIGIDITTFFELHVPECFTRSIYEKPRHRNEKVACMAPWCENYLVNGSLQKTGTSYKLKDDGKSLSYYLFCPDCGCEYAFNENNVLIERTYFINAYYKLMQFRNSEMSLKEISRLSKITEDRLKRCIAYFKGIGIFLDLFPYFYESDDILIQNFINSLNNGIHIKEIFKWSCWKSYNHFLLHRYNIRVLSTMKKNETKNPKKINNEYRNELVRKALDDMYKANIKITLESVCSKLQVCPETMRNWGGNMLIAEMKKKQNNKNQATIKNYYKIQINQYLQMNIDKKVSQGEVYSFLDLNRTVYWRKDPDFMRTIIESIKAHNKSVVNYNAPQCQDTKYDFVS